MTSSGAAASAAPAVLATMVAEGRGVLGGMARCGEELDAVVHALEGGYIRPAYGADPVRAGAAALPSGRNIHGIDPWRLPTDLALERGRRTAEALLERHRAAHDGAWPRTVAQALWAMDTIKTEGEGLGVVLALVGAEPERDGQGKIFRFGLIPLERLGRPRIDVLLDVSAVFRDTFQMSLDLLDDLFRRAALADEPADANFLRANTDALRAAGRSVDEATARIFTQAPGLYGTGVDELVEENQWEEAGQLADTYERRNAHTAGGARGGAAAPEVLRGLLGTVDHVFQAIDSVPCRSRRAVRGARASISAMPRRPAANRGSPAPTRCCASRRVPSFSTPSGTRRCWRMATAAQRRSATASPTWWVGGRSVRWTHGCTRTRRRPSCWTK
jgi:magnesium chelatase subunit H